MLCKRGGFSLVELSIVLVILGLLVGGVLSGQSLIRAAELRSISTEYSKFNAARLTFQDKYFSLPGDMPNAFAFWGAACGTNNTVASTGCNGNGNGLIEYILLGEHLKFWEHLSRAGLIEGAYDGTGVDSSGFLLLSKTNSPPSRFSNAIWGLMSTEGSNNSAFSPGYPYLLAIGIIDAGNVPLGYSSMTHGEAWSIDKKIDDGQATTGKVSGDSSANCWDFGTDYYGIQSVGENFSGDCILYFIAE